MGLEIAYPDLTGSSETQLKNIRSYLYQLTDKLNLTDFGASGVLNEISKAINLNTSDEAVEATSKVAEYSALKDLIIKTGDYTIENSDMWEKALSGSVAVGSSFGNYIQQTNLKITATSEGITQLYTYTAGINNDDGAAGLLTTQQYIKTGLLFYDNNIPKYGVGVGIIDLNLNGTIDLSSNILTTITADEWAFWSNGSKVAYINSSAINFPAANITGGSINIGSGAFTVSNVGALTATNATISGSITATSGTIGGCVIDSDGNLIVTSAHIGNISASKITSGTLDCDSITISGLTVTRSMIEDNAVNAAKIASSCITQALMASDSIGTAQLINGSVVTTIINANAVTYAKCAATTVQSGLDGGNDAANVFSNYQIADYCGASILTCTESFYVYSGDSSKKASWQTKSFTDGSGNTVKIYYLGSTTAP